MRQAFPNCWLKDDTRVSLGLWWGRVLVHLAPRASPKLDTASYCTHRSAFDDHGLDVKHRTRRARAGAENPRCEKWIQQINEMKDAAVAWTRDGPAVSRHQPSPHDSASVVAPTTAWLQELTTTDGSSRPAASPPPHGRPSMLHRPQHDHQL